MEIKVHVFAYLRKYLSNGKDNESRKVVLPDGATIENLCNELQIPLTLAKLTVIKGTQVPLDTPLKHGDEVSIFPPIAGG